MKTFIFCLVMIPLTLSPIWSADTKTSPAKINMDALEGITHYGMPIEEITKKYGKDGSLLTIVYSKTLSDDNMDDYVKRFYEEILHQIEKWLYENKLPAKDMRIVISNCKFCKIGYCKRKNIKEFEMVLYSNEKKIKSLSFKYAEIFDKEKYIDMARSAVIIFLDAR